MNDCRLTTIDNPYDPFNQFVEWFLFDTEMGYNTCSRLDRLLTTREDASEKEADIEREAAIDRLIEIDFLNIYKKVYRNTENDTEKDQKDSHAKDIDSNIE